MALTQRACVGLRALLRLGLALGIVLAWTFPRAEAGHMRKGFYTSLTGTIDYVQQVNSSMKRDYKGDQDSSFHDDQHKLHINVNALYSQKYDGFLGSVTETVSSHDGNLGIKSLQDKCQNVLRNYKQQLGDDDLYTGKYMGHATVKLDIMDHGSDFAHPVFDDPYGISLEFASNTFGGEDRARHIDSNDDPCLAEHDQGKTTTYPVPELHADPGIEGHPDKNPRSVHVLTGKIITIDEVPSGEHGTATTTITWRLRYCEMVGDLAPLAPMTC